MRTQQKDPHCLIQVFRAEGVVVERPMVTVTSDTLLQCHKMVLFSLVVFQVTVTGIEGIGKSALVTAVAYYFLERARNLHFEGVVFLGINRKTFDPEECSSFGDLFFFEVTQLSSNVDESKDDCRTNEALCSVIGERSYLLILDNVDHLEKFVGSYPNLHLRKFLELLLRVCPNVKVMLSSRVTSRSLNEQRLNLGPFLNTKKDTTSLFIKLSPTLNLADYEGLGLVSQTPRLLEETDFIKRLGGNPGKIVRAARLMNVCCL